LSFNFKQICENFSHTERVMGIAINANEGLIYSCGTDKKVIVSQDKFFENPIGMSISCKKDLAYEYFGFTALEYDKPNFRLFATNEVGEFYIFTVETVIFITIASILVV